jgi:hypothetical protein
MTGDHMSAEPSDHTDLGSPLGPRTRPLGRLNIVTRPVVEVDENARVFDGGPVRISIEYRLYNRTAVEKDYARTEQGTADLAKIEEYFGGNIPEDEGYSLHVYESSGGIERLRFDMFANDPHYHYIRNQGRFISVAYDPYASGNMFEWVMDAMRHRLPDMLRASEAANVANYVDPGTISGVVDEIRRFAPELRDSVRARSARDQNADETRRPVERN